MDAIEERIYKILREKFNAEPERSMHLTALGIDSIGMAELTFDLEKAFSIRVDEDILSIESVGELIEYIRVKQSAVS
jgi:acyl carrier protein